ncbi:uncharacterized protein LY79DRAFT_528660 [Colletotrichum navitas]|uniref:Rhodopsin domain-containing protein n=1 Tax=Colletotrichum navitas TaxID=681940 RepID=A0AAD8UXQ8_9PEZI|nr:uncharacterized protein LY79DRAFT_528660 [Colletotrichum navitas]KAK1569446.1 hypothetical protein LY79DRAFT_528660 [Colletotrichum navitas]
MSSPAAEPDAVLFGAAQNIDGRTLIAIGWGNASTSFIFLLFRLLIRWRRNRRLLLDDYCIILGWLFLLSLVVIQMEQTGPMYYLIHLQAGRLIPTSLQEVSQQTEQWLRWSYAMNYIYWTGLWAVKASILTVFFHLVSPVPVLKKAWYSVALFTLLAYIGGWVTGALTCDRFTDSFVPGKVSMSFLAPWTGDSLLPQLNPSDSAIVAGKCISPREVDRVRYSAYYAAAVDIATDLMIMGLPIAMLPSLQLEIRKKLGLAVAFSLALITILIAVIRMTQAMKGHTLDKVGLSIWSITELGVSIIVGSLPPLRILFTSGFRRYIRGKKADHRSSAKDRDGNGDSPTLTTIKMLEKYDKNRDDELRRTKEEREEAARRSREEAREWADASTPSISRRIRQDIERAREQTRAENEARERERQRERERSIERGRQRNR